ESRAAILDVVQLAKDEAQHRSAADHLQQEEIAKPIRLERRRVDQKRAYERAADQAEVSQRRAFQQQEEDEREPAAVYAVTLAQLDQARDEKRQGKAAQRTQDDPADVSSRCCRRHGSTRRDVEHQAE